MRRRNPTTETPSGRTRATRMSVVTKRRGPLKSMAVIRAALVSQSDESGVLHLEMRNGDVIQIHFPHPLIGVVWASRQGIETMTVNGAHYGLQVVNDFRACVAQFAPDALVPPTTIAGVAYELERMWSQAYGFSEDAPDVKEMRRIAIGVLKLLRSPEARIFFTRTANLVETVNGIMSVADEVFDGFGIEGIDMRSRTRAVYVNTGDIYGRTLLFDYSYKDWHLTPAGDFIERNGDD